MPDPRRLFRAAALALVPGIAQAEDCAPALTLLPTTPDRVLAVYVAPCAPYVSVTVSFGPLVFGEQTGDTGALLIDLPSRAGGGTLDVTIDGTIPGSTAGTVGVVVPAPAGPVPPLAAISWPDAPPPDPPGARWAESGHGAAPRRLGFPGEVPVVDLLPATADHVDLPLTAATCGRTITAAIITGDTTRDLRVTLPDCGGPTGALRIPLAP